MKFLIVDDHPILCQGFAAIAAGAWPGVSVVAAYDGAAMRRELAAHPDLTLIVLDLFIPGGDEFALLREVRGGWPELPVVVLSASEDNGVHARALALGASDCVTKSGGAAALVQAISRVLGDHAPPPPVLTPRQIEVLRLVAQGLPNRNIAVTLGLSEKTVKAHLATAFLTLGASNRTHAIAVARSLAML